MDPKTEKSLETWYQQFHRDHDASKEDLAKRLESRSFKASASQESVTSEDNVIESAYDQFIQRHDELKQQLLADIPQDAPTSQRSVGSFSSSTKLALQLAVCLLAIAGCFLIPSLFTKPVYALDDVLSRVSDARSVFISGYSYSLSIPGEEIPVGFYAKTPNTFWTTVFATLRDEKGETYFEDGYRASNGYVLHQRSNNPTEAMLIDNLEQADLPIWAKLEMLTQLSQSVTTEIFFSSTEGFEVKGTERFEGVLCDVFERISGNTRQRLYVDPDRMIPVGAARYATDKSGNEVPILVINRVEVNPIEIPDYVTIDPPIASDARFSTREELPTANVRFTKGNRYTTQQMIIPFALRVGNSTLVCWATPNGIAQTPQLELVTTGGKEIAATVLEIGQTDDGSVMWNWVQLTPTDSDQPGMPSVKANDNTIVPIELGIKATIDAINSFSSDDQQDARDRIFASIGISDLPQPQL